MRRSRRPFASFNANSAKKMIGHVKWFSEAKGYGFINAQHGINNIFVHYTSIQTPGYKVLDKDQLVVFQMADGPQGQVALNVVPVTKVTT